MNKHVFEERCQNNPQGVIDDLVKQTTRQAKAIHDQNKEIERLNGEIENLNKIIEGKPVRKKRTKK
ncbi:MAG: hypothetical protein DWQ19_11435 [Crenarchaeota archaeon]|nr:MAG: hypothetical protein DWQ19_11435 [Thermoproteota archaeon]